MKVRDVYTRNVVTASRGEDLETAASRMDFHALGCLVVLDGRSLIGLLSERDVLHAAAEGRALGSVIVNDYMTREVLTVDPDNTLEEAAAAMVTLGARHLPVCEGGTVVGMISARDLVAVEGFGELAEQVLSNMDDLPSLA
ncbi:MAG: CBS domain-containing protein [Actinomycetota bacterium]